MGRKLVCGVSGFAALLILITIVGETSAAPIIFAGFDAGVGPGGARPNSDAAAASFDAAASALGVLNLLDLESTPATSATTVFPAPGVTMNFDQHTTSFNTILDSDFDAENGYNTTIGGDTWALIFPQDLSRPNSLEFVFDTPVQAWGMYHTGVGSVSADVSVQFNNGSAQVFSLIGAPSGGVGFFGFTDAGFSIDSITILVEPNPTSGDAVGVDDIRYVHAAPEPTTLALLGLGLMGLGFARKRAAR